MSLEELAEDARAFATSRGDAWHDLPDVSLLDAPGSTLYWYHGAYRIKFDDATSMSGCKRTDCIFYAVEIGSSVNTDCHSNVTNSPRCW